MQRNVNEPNSSLKVTMEGDFRPVVSVTGGKERLSHRI